MSHHTNIVRIRVVYRALRELKDDVVFVGGATISLYSDREGFEVRPTDDVDVIVEILNYAQRTLLEEKLRGVWFLKRYGVTNSLSLPDSRYYCGHNANR